MERSVLELGGTWLVRFERWPCFILWETVKWWVVGSWNSRVMIFIFIGK